MSKQIVKESIESNKSKGQKSPEICNGKTFTCIYYPPNPHKQRIKRKIEMRKSNECQKSPKKCDLKKLLVSNVDNVYVSHLFYAEVYSQRFDKNNNISTLIEKIMCELIPQNEWEGLDLNKIRTEYCCQYLACFGNFFNNNNNYFIIRIFYFKGFLENSNRETNETWADFFSKEVAKLCHKKNQKNDF